MPWKEPGDKPREPRDREPWGPRGGGQGGGPDLGAWLGQLRRRLGPFGRGPAGVLAVLGVAVALWIAIGAWVVVGAQQVGVLLRLGRVESVLQPGLHLRFPPPIDSVVLVDTGRTRNVGDEARLLTRDGQLVLVDYEVRYRVTDARAFLFGVRDAEQGLRDAATAAVRAAVGAHPLPCLIPDLGTPCAGGAVDADRLAAAVVAQLRARPGDAMDGDGIEVTGAAVTNVGVPSDVKPAFDAIARAQDDVKTARASAEADVARSKLETVGRAAALKTDAAAYRRQAVADAQAAVARFNAVLPQYQANPEVTRHSLWLSAMHDVLMHNHVVVNTGAGNVIVQFPVEHGGVTTGAAASAPAASASVAPAASASAAPPVTSGPGMQAVDR